MNISIKKITLFLVCLLIFLSLFIPRNISGLKLGLILLALLPFFFQGRFGINPHNTSFKFMVLYLLYALWSSIIGFMNHNPDTFLLFRLNVIYFMMLFIWIMNITTRRDFLFVLRTCCYSAISISVYTLLFFAQSIHIINLPFFIYLDNSSGAMIHSGYVHITNMNMSMMLFLFPVILFLNGIDDVVADPKFVRLNKTAITISIIAMMLSGRRIVWVVVFGGIACYVLFKMEKSQSRRVIKITAIIVGVIIAFYFLSRMFGINIEGFVDRFEEAFRDYDNYGRENARWIQLKALWNGFLKNPVIGSGAGIGVADYIRSTEHSSSYELSYLLILYNSGIIGFVPYVLSLMLVVRRLHKYGKEDGIAKALMFGLIFGLIANATNPYFSSSFDFLLWIFIPLMYLNVYEAERKMGYGLSLGKIIS